MITVSDYKIRQTEDGRTFIALELIGGLEFIPSMKTGKHYATTRRCSMASTFDEVTAKMMIGSQVPGHIIREWAEPYAYTIKETGEVILLDYHYVYAATLQNTFIEKPKVLDLEPAVL